MVKKGYCEEHPRVKLERGKCIACGEVDYEIKKDLSINMQIAIVSAIICVFLIGIIILNTVFT